VTGGHKRARHKFHVTICGTNFQFSPFCPPSSPIPPHFSDVLNSSKCSNFNAGADLPGTVVGPALSLPKGISHAPRLTICHPEFARPSEAKESKRRTCFLWRGHRRPRVPS
jgi:hypothetical protein